MFNDSVDGPWDLIYHKRPPTINWERKLHHHQRAKFVREWREAFIDLAEQMALPKGLSQVGFEVLPILPTRALQDAANCLPAAKAAIDGLIEKDEGSDKHGYGLIPDDGPEFVPWIVFFASVYEKGVAALWLRVHAL